MASSSARAPRLRTALAIGGLDPSAGAGIVADVRAIRLAGVWGAAVCAALTVQSTRRLRRVEAVPTALVIAQTEELLSDLDVRAAKTGALGSAATVRAIADIVAARPRMALVVDPLQLPSRGTAALNRSSRAGVQAMRRLVGQATLLTPNVPEAEAMLGGTIESSAQARDAAVALLEHGCDAVLLKGGHLPHPRATVVDWLASRRGLRRLAHRRLALPEVHGTGCVLASLIAGRLAARRARVNLTDDELVDIVRWATRMLGRQLRAAQRVGGGMQVLGAPALTGAAR